MEALDFSLLESVLLGAVLPALEVDLGLPAVRIEEGLGPLGPRLNRRRNKDGFSLLSVNIRDDYSLLLKVR